jgi:hypothetical protein
MHKSTPGKLSHQEQRRAQLRRLNVRWPAWLALLIVAMLYEALPKELYWGPRGLFIGLVVVLLIPSVVTFWRSSLRTNRIISLTINILVTFYMLISVFRIVLAVLQGHIGPAHLLFSSITLWVTNILVFALWYWNLDEGGPNQREMREGSRIAAFFFPQAQIADTLAEATPHSIKHWEPHFIDYLFLAFNTSTAFSPTDTPVISRWAKCMSMMQALISLTIVVMLAARAINILSPTGNYLVS